MEWEEKVTRVSVRDIRRGRRNLEDLGVDGRIILRWILKE
jgi:hypothetical protein